MDDASGLGGQIVADPRAELRRHLDEFAQRVADEALAAPIPKASATQGQPKQTNRTVPSSNRPAPGSRKATATVAPTSATTSPTISAGAPKVAAAPATKGKGVPAVGILMTASAVVGLVAFINSQQSQRAPTLDLPFATAPEPAPVDAAPAAPEATIPEAAPAAPAPEDYSYMYSWTDEALRVRAQSYQPGYLMAESILAQRQAAREATAYSEAQGSITNLVRFIRNWPGGSYVESARSDLLRTIQDKRYNNTLKVWVTKSGTYAYRSPTYEADWLTFNSSSSSWPTTATISNEGVTWYEMPVNFQGQDINVYVPQSSLSFSDPNYRAPSPPPPPTTNYTPPPATTQPYPAAPVPPQAPVYVTIGARRWADEPSDSQFQKISEKMHIRSALTITVDCRVGSDYRLGDCRVLAPTDLNDRQWNGALDLAELYTAPKISADGYATKGNRVKITFEFEP